MASSSSTGGRGIAVKQPSAVVGNQFYKEALENASHFNARVVMERKMRLPFLDTLTGVAQTNCSLWMSQSQRRPGIAPGQIYTFPAKRWRKKRRAYFAQVNPPLTQEAAKDATLENALGLDSEAANNLIDSVLKDSEDSKDAVDEIDDIPDAGELEDSSSSDDETYTRRKRKRVRWHNKFGVIAVEEQDKCLPTTAGDITLIGCLSINGALKMYGLAGTAGLDGGRVSLPCQQQIDPVAISINLSDGEAPFEEWFVFSGVPCQHVRRALWEPSVLTSQPRLSAWLWPFSGSRKVGRTKGGRKKKKEKRSLHPRLMTETSRMPVN
ncbi:Zinc finger protein ubi-d4, partial [Branchiostoma belcheri]